MGKKSTKNLYPDSVFSKIDRRSTNLVNALAISLILGVRYNLSRRICWISSIWKYSFSRLIFRPHTLYLQAVLCLILGYSSDTTKKMMEAESNLDVLRKALIAVFGAAIPVRCVVVGERGGSVDDPDVEGNSMVHAAIGLGGKIVDKR